MTRRKRKGRAIAQIMPAPAATSSEWVAQMTQAQQELLLAKRLKVQAWVDHFASAMGRRRPPQVRIAPAYSYYDPIRNAVCIPAQTMWLLDDRLLWILVAHECGHFYRRWRLFLSNFSAVAREGEELIADRIAMKLTGATMDDLVACYKAAASLEGGFEGMNLNEQLDLRRKLMAMCFGV